MHFPSSTSSTRMQPPVQMSRPQGLPTARSTELDLGGRLEADHKGRTLVISFETEILVPPSLDVKQRLKREFGLYARGREEPFSGSQQVDRMQGEVTSLHMIAADAADLGEERLQFKRHSSTTWSTK